MSTKSPLFTVAWSRSRTSGRRLASNVHSRPSHKENWSLVRPAQQNSNRRDAEAQRKRVENRLRTIAESLSDDPGRYRSSPGKTLCVSAGAFPGVSERG